WLGAGTQVVVAEEPASPGDLLGYPDLQSRAALDGAHVVPGIGHLVEGAGVQPGGASWQHLHVQTVPFQVGAVDIGDLVLATRTGLQGPRELDDVRPE